MTPNLLHFGLTMLFRRLSEPGVVKGFEGPLTIKNQNTQLNKKNVRYG